MQSNIRGSFPGGCQLPKDLSLSDCLLTRVLPLGERQLLGCPHSPVKGQLENASP